MSEPDLVGLFIAPLEQLGLEYMLTGGVASVAYGDPRFTRDVDLVLELPPRAFDSFLRAFPSPEFHAPPLEVLAREVERSEGGRFNVITGIRHSAPTSTWPGTSSSTSPRRDPTATCGTSP